MGWVSTERNHDEQPITVGVIDDDPMICQMMRLILEDYSSGRISAVSTCTSNRLSPDVTKHAPCSTLCRSANVKRPSSRPKDSQMQKSVKECSFPNARSKRIFHQPQTNSRWAACRWPA